MLMEPTPLVTVIPGQVALLLPPKPEEPLDSECCGSGCTPCVFDIYKEKLKGWENDCEKMRMGDGANCSFDDVSKTTDSIISPYEYGSYVVQEIIEDCQACKIISFVKTGGEHAFCIDRRNFPVKIGQHVVLKIEEKSRQYTVLDVRKNGSFTIIFKIYESGLLTPSVNRLAVGDEVRMRGPFGKEFKYMPNVYNQLIMIGGGTGIAPFCRIIDEVLQNENDETRILLLYGCRNENEVLLLNKMKEWSRSWNFQVRYFLSRVKDMKKAQSLHYGMKITCGKIDKTVIQNLEEIKLNNNLYFICGTKSFDKDVLNYLKSVGINEDKIKLF